MSIIDLINTAGRSINRKAFLIGVGSLIDLNGMATYEAMQDLMPDPKLRPLQDLYSDTNRTLSLPK
ncbi:hypothetical protein [Mycolicibacterium fortuitum]|uniref:hypothetical protein n=1 Tax=Mycolicibacterium fortuitum TaxID=1766 RepID=UPI0007E93D72|nr:hypothetical protein [Mycolicibacterium fortuitum]MDG5773975.1 hypothetical protein [Mycolicibacterium fortuitum]MDG5779639.1 hypothetical protein [Mycolicibacterium fortuitum]MDG5779721.1 hypothetical protein [Mycolicibacterium fortuitum]OBB42475.1 hypothetical protein A5754_14630 [Mycolicibacterium fortuitum]OBF74207.1 hypothetical protein A5751_27440 [Mycolicibacterium fortuitum]